MPNFDTGHYFLTTLAPIKSGTTLDDRDVSVSYEQRVRTRLAILPTALQSPATEAIGLNSPFSRNRRTHLCRFMVLDDVVYNGRVPRDPIVTVVSGEDPINPQSVDRLNAAYLMFAVDFDAVMKDGDPLPANLSEAEQDKVRDAYAGELWRTMSVELREVYDNCEGFDGVSSESDFADYIRRCQVETTMPFNDYWLTAPKLNNLPVSGLAALVLIPLVVMLFGLASCIFGWSVLPPVWTFLGGLVATAAALWIAYAYTMWNGNRPMPPGEYADLPSVLKSLYLQQAFSGFAIDTQGKSDAELHNDFGAFLQQHKPQDKMAPSQEPGVISSGL